MRGFTKGLLLNQHHKKKESSNESDYSDESSSSSNSEEWSDKHDDKASKDRKTWLGTHNNNRNPCRDVKIKSDDEDYDRGERKVNDIEHETDED